MTKMITLDEWLFVLGVYPSLNAIEKFSLFAEMVEESAIKHVFKGANPLCLELDTKNIKKLSPHKKASFVRFLKDINIVNEMRKYQDQNISWIHLFSEKYPKMLRQIYSPPVVLFYKGDIEIIDKHIWLGVVGARAHTPYGTKVVDQLLNGLIKESKQAIGIVSGLAKGIDRQAHVETIKNNGSTIGVIGTGLDIFYPYHNQSLQEQMSKEQLVLSEYPLTSKPLKFHFPERNRIIAGLSRGVLVVEAKKRSGSLITAYNALDENRDVFAVPGSIFEENREGCHKLIELGAVLVQSHKDILKEWFLI